MMETEVMVVGAGLAGLACAMELQRAGRSVLVFEAAPRVGGRLQTTVVDGFHLDHGFQVLLTSYPELKRFLHLESLHLGSFEPGARIWKGGGFSTFADPIRRPSALLSGLRSPLGTIADKLRVLELRRRLGQCTVEEIFARPEVRTRERLREEGFGDAFVDVFFRSFYGGIFLERELRSSSRMFEFLFKMFSEGIATIPKGGIQAIPEQMASKLKPGTVKLGNPVVSVKEGGVELADGSRCRGRVVVVATEGPAAVRLLGLPEDPGSRSVTCWYFTAGEPPVEGAWLCLNGETSGPVNNLCVVNQVTSGCAPTDQNLISATVLGDESEATEEEVRDQMRGWFGSEVDTWALLKPITVRHAQPEEPQIHVVRCGLDPWFKPGMIVCGDWREDVSINGALMSGRRAAEAILAG